MNEWIELGRETLTKPRQAARKVLALGIPDQVWWMALALSAIISSAMVSGQVMLSGLSQDQVNALPMFGGPLRAAIVVFIVAAITVWCMAKLGRIFGGTGDVSGALALSGWLQVVMTVLSVGLTVIGLALPVVEALATILLLLVSVWIFVVFVAELHGFQHIALVFLGVMGAGFLVGSLLSVLAVATGLIAVPEVPQNV
ncbi:hypothetical protein ACMU_11775 [Actibacterium mucosum KCTC 23349]|uniref:Yip1 domain-containing protein n=1 Tax=Actibacterium mucosum KCTC 23349 TaxID=1454373 RepID=A0A037ZIJ2_9RHOB|nr:YIP1 family protein [Actibacterium mucosum]KAJ55367.1 hypothetical protein ACMU_11775 [Actibacterium mucosum KCTC 23349]